MSLRYYEQAVIDRLESVGNPLGWKPYKRDEKGDAIMKTVLKGRDRDGRECERHCLMKITPRGLIYDEVRVYG